MLEKLSKRISSFFVAKSVIKRDEQELYDYCFEILLSTIVNLLIVLSIAIITNTFLYCICYVTTFMICRATVGGYHADTHFRCLLILLLAYGIYTALLLSLNHQSMSILSCSFIVISIFIILLFAPVEDKNKPLSRSEKKKLKTQSLFVVLLLVLLTAIFLISGNNISLLFTISSATFTISVSMLAGVVKNFISEKL